MSAQPQRIVLAAVVMVVLAASATIWIVRLAERDSTEWLGPSAMPDKVRAPSSAELQSLRELESAFDQTQRRLVPVTELPMPVVTDRGNPIQLYRPLPRPEPPPPQAFHARAELERLLNLTRTGDHDAPYNCHGWVFTGGRFWLEQEDVDLILRDNGYSSFADPRPGDVVVYLSDDNIVEHTGLVRVVSATGVEIEGQWGNMGRYRHDVTSQIYSRRIAYLRSPRSGHLVRGLPPGVE